MEPDFSRPCPLSSGHIQAGKHLGTNAEVAAWKAGSTEPRTWRTLSFGRGTSLVSVAMSGATVASTGLATAAAIAKNQKQRSSGSRKGVGFQPRLLLL